MFLVIFFKKSSRYSLLNRSGPGSLVDQDGYCFKYPELAVPVHPSSETPTGLWCLVPVSPGSSTVASLGLGMHKELQKINDVSELIGGHRSTLYRKIRLPTLNTLNSLNSQLYTLNKLKPPIPQTRTKD